MTDADARSSPTRRRSVLFAAAAGFAAVVLFAVEPLQAKLLLPVVGGTPLAWAVVTAFFQVAVLAGYALAHTLRLVVPRWALAPVVATLLGLGAVWGPADPSTLDTVSTPHLPLDGDGLAARIGWILVRELGVTVVALSMVSPLLQHLFAHPARSRTERDDPYWLYAASNAGSVGILLAYPLTIARWWDLPLQSTFWRAGLGVLAALVLLCGTFVAGRPSSEGRVAAPNTSGRPPWTTMAGWGLRSALASALVLAATNHVTTDLAPTPILWSWPLAVYLGSFIVAFSRFGEAATSFARRHAALVVIPLVPLLALGIAMPAALVTAVHLVGLATICIALHGEVARRRPDADRLTSFYLWLGLGGAVGGLLVAFGAPLVFPGPWEYPLLVAAGLVSCAWRSPPKEPEETHAPPVGIRADLPAIFVALGLAAALAWLRTEDPVTGTTIHYAPFGLVVLLAFRSHRWPVTASVAAAAFVLLAYFGVEWSRPVIIRARSAFGSYRVAEDERHDVRYLAHGHTVHGAQRRGPPGESWALPYWPPGSPAARVMTRAQRSSSDRSDGGVPRIAVLGLGVGAMASFIEPDTRAEFWEIDPVVVRLARERFRFVDSCGRACEVHVGDGRIGLERAPLRHYDLIVLDAFSSSAVPTHLLTIEAVEMYVRHLRPHGVLLVHITNHHVDLEPVLGAAAAQLQLVAWQRHYVPDVRMTLALADTGSEAPPFVAASRWVMIARDEAALEALVDRSNWSVARSQPRVAAWSDRHSDLLDVLVSGPRPSGPSRR